MKIGLLLCANLEKAQYLYKYIDILDSWKCDYDIIYWNRLMSDFKIKCKGNFIPYEKEIDSFKPLKEKLFSYIRFSYFINKTVRRNNYDRLIIFTTPTAISLLKLCLFKYRKNYIFDFRDLTKEYIAPYRVVTQLIARFSALFCVSSPGYLQYFNKKKYINYVVCHNTYSNIEFKQTLKICKKEPIKVVYWGAVRQVEYNKRICELFGNDKRFEFVFHGEGAYEELKRHCDEHNINNISFTGRYRLGDIAEFAKNTDILFNAYDTDFVTTPSLAVKVYDSLVYQLPMIVSQNTFMNQYLNQYSFVFAFYKKSKNVLDRLYDWYMALDENIIKKEFVDFQKIIINDERIYKKKLKEYLFDGTGNST